MSYPAAPPPYNPSAPPPQPSGGVGFEQYQQAPPPPYSTHPYQAPYEAPYPQQPQHGYYQPYGQPQHVYTQQPKTVYVYDDQRRRNDGDAAECFLWGLCAACLCCCLLDS